LSFIKWLFRSNRARNFVKVRLSGFGGP
jgi:hypothetical protein